MPVIELQLRLRTLADVVTAQVLTTPLPAAQVADLLAQGRFVERVAVTGVTPADLPGWAGPDPGPGALTLRVAGELGLTDVATLRATAPLQPPAVVETVPVELFVVFTASTGGLDYRLAGMRAGLAPVPDLPALSGTIPLADGGFTAVTALLRADPDADLLAVRLGTDPGDRLDGPLVDRLGASTYGLFVPGQALADLVGQVFLDAVRDAAKGSSDPAVFLTGTTGPSWLADEPRAVTRVAMLAADALPLGLPLPFTVSATTQFVRKAAAPPVHGFYLDVRTTVHWSAGDVLLDLVTFGGFFGALQDGLNDGLAGRLSAPTGARIVERTSDSVTFTQFMGLPGPRSPVFSATTDDATVDGDGLAVRGRIDARLDVSAAWDLAPSTWETTGDCTTRTFRRVRRPARLSVAGRHPYHQIRLLAPPHLDGKDRLVDRSARWRVSTIRHSDPGAVPVTLQVLYELPGSVHEEDAASDPFGWVYTNVGVRRIRLEVQRVGAALSGPSRQAALLALISDCMARSDRWGQGVLNLDWLGDPPDLDLGRPPLREWTVSGTDVAVVSEVLAVAVGPSGERVAARLPVTGGRLFAQVVTAADETLELRTGAAMAGPVPQVSRRWIVPVDSAPGQGSPLRTQGAGAATVSLTYGGEVVRGVALPALP